jgi:hypothetical protein
MHEFGQYIVFETEGDKIKQIDVHRVIRKIRPWNFVESAMFYPKLRNGQVVNKGIP